MVASRFTCVLLFTVACADETIKFFYNDYDDPAKIWKGYDSWMSELENGIELSFLSIPGTHHSMARNTNLDHRTQALSLEDQLHAGIRVLHIGVRHLHNHFEIQHGKTPLGVGLGDALRICNKFLEKHPTEVILVFLDEQENEANCNRSVSETFLSYRDEKPEGARIWHGTYVPSMGEVRGKIVIIDGLGGVQNRGIPRIDVWENNYNVPDGRSWVEEVNRVMDNVLLVQDISTLTVNWLSSEGNYFEPQKLAKYVNEQFFQYLWFCRNQYSQRPLARDTPDIVKYAIERSFANHYMIRVVMMDFPGVALIPHILSLNYGLMRHDDPIVPPDS